MLFLGQPSRVISVTTTGNRNPNKSRSPSLVRFIMGAFLWAMALLRSEAAAFAAGPPTPTKKQHTVLPLHYPSSTWTFPTKLTSVSSSSSSESAALVADSNDATTTTTPQTLANWKTQLLQISNWASLLCVLDCTALPLVTVVLPLFGLVAATPAQMAWLHDLGHAIALWFVLPVGGSATLLNYLYAHQQKRIAFLGVCGLVLVAAANAPHSWIHALHDTILYPLVHAVHHGVLHRVTNLLGCACLLASNYLSKQSGKCLHGHDHSDCADHKHNHSHNHSHDHSHDH